MYQLAIKIIFWIKTIIKNIICWAIKKTKTLGTCPGCPGSEWWGYKVRRGLAGARSVSRWGWGSADTLSQTGDGAGVGEWGSWCRPGKYKVKSQEGAEAGLAPEAWKRPGEHIFPCEQQRVGLTKVAKEPPPHSYGRSCTWGKRGWSRGWGWGGPPGKFIHCQDRGRHFLERYESWNLQHEEVYWSYY